MAYDAKILLTINLEGGVLLRGEPEVRKYYLTKKDLYPKFKGDGNKIVKSGKYLYYPTYKSTAKQKLTLCREAYESFISDVCPKWMHSIKEWKKMSETERLEKHLQRICDSFRGKSFSYQVIED